MKPEGRKIITAKWKRDVHPKKGWVNWWETICDLTPRSTRKQKLKERTV